MKAQRLEAFTDGVLAIVITIMVLELRVPESAEPAALLATAPLLFAYLLSFINIGIFWANHHHMFQAARQVSGSVLWANLSLLFWLSLVPFVIRWIDERGVAAAPVAAYGIVLLLCAIAYYILSRTLLALHGTESALSRALGSDVKGRASVAIYAAAVPLAFVHPMLGFGLYVLVAVVWLVPDRRIERTLDGARETHRAG